MSNVVARIVLTGGPCAGKTSALSRIEQKYTDKGYSVLVVSESATELINGGIKCFGSNPLEVLDFQELLLKYQIMKEKVYEEAVLKMKSKKPCIIIYDRGLLDNKAYINQKKFDGILKNMGLNEIDVMDQYDMVIHLVTAADGAKEFYTLGNNSARSEGIEEAIALDQRTINAWLGHSNLKIIDNNSTFSNKLNKVIDTIDNQIGIYLPTKKQRKYLVDLSKSKLDFNEDNSTCIHIEQAYLNDSSNEIRLRKRILDNNETYYLTRQHQNLNGSSVVYTDKKISENEFYSMLDGDYRYIEKDRYCFSKGKVYYKLDVFGNNNLGILETNSVNSKIPSFINVIDDVTNDSNWYNYNMADSKSKKLTLDR